MALINRFEIVNYLDKMDEAGKWQPNFRFLQFVMQGLSSLIRLDNGQGKTSIASTMYLLLTRKRSLAAEVAEKMSPAKLSSWSHIRIEVIVNDDSQPLFTSAGAGVTGETWVFGVCGHKEDGLKFYFYPGVLEDLPAAHRHGDKTVFLTNKEFVENQKLLGRVRWEPSEEDYKAHLSSIFPPRAFDLGLDLHLRGGAENDDIFPIHGKHPESELFYSHIAPHLLASDVQTDESADDGEYFFEETIIKSATLYGKATVQTEAKREEVQKFTRTVQQGARLRAAAEDAKAKAASAKEARKGIDSGLVILDRIVQEQAIPGIPNESAPEGLLGTLVKGLVWHTTERELCLQDSTLAPLVSKNVSHLNQEATRGGSVPFFNKEKERLVLSPSGALKLEKQSRGKVYPIESVYKFLDGAGYGFPEGLNLKQIKDLVVQATTWWRDHVDTNPSRPIVRKNQFRITTLEGKIGDLAVELKNLEERRSQASEELQGISDLKRAWDDLSVSALFTDEDLRAPKALGERVKKSWGEVGRQIQDHNLKTAELEALKPSYEWCIKQFPGTSPEQALEAQESREKLLNERVKSAREEVSLAKKALNENNRGVLEARRKLNDSEGTGKTFEGLEPGVQIYTEIFGEEDPSGLSGRVKKELNDTKERITGNQKERGLIAKEVQLVQGFERKYPSADCSILIAQVQGRSETLQKEINKLEEQKTDCGARLKDLREHRIAPSPSARAALDLVLPPRKVHEVIAAAGLPPERLASVLFSLSSVLFSPVFTSPAAAQAAVETLEKHRLPVPVFLEKSLTEYARNHHFQHEGKLHFSVLAGTETLTASTILDPERIHALIEESVGELSALELRIETLQNEKRPLDEQLKYLAEVDRAIRLDVVGRSAQLERNIQKDQEKLPGLEKRASEEALLAIRDRQEYDRLGGADAAGALLATIQESKRLLSLAEEADRAAYERVEVAEASQNTAQEEFTTFLTNWGKAKTDIQSAIKFLEHGGPNFLSTAESVKNGLQKTLSSIEEKIHFNFEAAQKFLDSGSKPKELASLLEEIKETINNKNGEKNSLETEKKQKEQQTAKEQERMVRLDEGVSDILSLWKDFYEAIREFTGGAQIRSLKDLRGLVAGKAPALETYFIAVDRINQNAKEGGDAHRLKASFDLITEELNAFGDKISIVRRKQKDALTARVTLKEECTRYLESVEGLSVNERAIIAEENADFDEILELFNKLEKICRNEKTKLDELERGVEAITAKAHERLVTLLEFARDNRKLLKQVASRSAEGTIIIDDTMIEDDALKDLIRNLLMAVEVELRSRRERKKSQVGLESTKEEKDWDKNLKKQIAEWLYRGVFPTAKVKVKHPSVRGGQPITFRKKGISSGERLAIALVIIGKLQEFIQEREERQQIKNTARRKKRGKTQGILLLDGIFSKLSQKEMIQVAMDAYRGLKGRFQLIGLNHYPIENDEEVFPNFFEVRKVTTTTGGFLVLDKDYKPVSPAERGMETGELVAARTTIVRPPTHSDGLGESSQNICD